MTCAKCGRMRETHANCANCAVSDRLCHLCGKDLLFTRRYGSTRSQMIQGLNIVWDPFRVIFHPQHRPAGRPRFLYVGRDKSVANGVAGRHLTLSRQRGRLSICVGWKEVKSWRIGAR